MSELVSSIGEFDLIERLQDVLPMAIRQSPQVPFGIGDDAAAWRSTPGKMSVITTDALVDGVHFRMDWMDWRSLGWKSLAVNLSDLAAMGARPVLATFTLGLTGRERVAELEEFYRGIGDLASPYRVVVGGGDVVRSPGGFVISVTVIGEVAQARMLTRAGARAGDMIAVTGSLGASAAGLELLGDPALAATATTAGLLIAAHLRPQPRLDVGSMLADYRVTSAMDLSDGIAGDLPKILDASDVGAWIDVARLPVLPAIRALFPQRWEMFALAGGEDYELLFTVPAARFGELRDAASDRGSTVTAIGEITLRSDRKDALTIYRDDEIVPLRPKSWNHFG